MYWYTTISFAAFRFVVRRWLPLFSSAPARPLLSNHEMKPYNVSPCCCDFHFTLPSFSFTINTYLARTFKYIYISFVSCLYNILLRNTWNPF